MSAPEELTEADRRALRIEIAVVLAVTFGLSAYTAVLDLVEAMLLNLSKQTVALNPRLSPFDLINLGLNLARVAPADRVGRARALSIVAQRDRARQESGSVASAGAPMCSAASASPP